MDRLLYIKASPMRERSFSVAVADNFIKSYSDNHPRDNVEVVELFERHLPAFDFQAVSAKYKIMHQKEHSKAEKDTWQEIISLIEEFKSADKYVFAVPMWNFSIPYRLKQYIDIIVQPGLTFAVTEDGRYEGLVKDKPVFVAYARGGEYPSGSEQEAFDMQKRYFELILGFIGLSDIRSVVVEPTLASSPDVAKEKLACAVNKAKQIANEF